METRFSPDQLADPKMAEAEQILRKCVHCGFCTATCPTYVTLGNELDSPRGRIYLIKDMLENGRAADKQVVTHIDRCLSCLACTTTCPSGVDYMHLIDHARAHVEKTWKRPLAERFTRNLLAFVMPSPSRFRMALKLANLGRPFGGLMKRIAILRPFGAMLDLAPRSVPPHSPSATPGTFPPANARRGRVILQSGCVQPVLKPGINEAAIELLGNLGVEVVVAAGERCCGSLVHHMGREEQGLEAARVNIDAWLDEIDARGADALIITASGCGNTIKDYAYMLRHDPAYAQKAARISALTRDITEYLSGLDLEERPRRVERVTYHAACSLQHGQKVTVQPKALLQRAGFQVREPAESHLCCGSAGTYNILQPEISGQLKARKVRNLQATGPDIIATGNIGCITQIASGMNVPVIHIVELLNWAWGGRKPDGIA
jgi:glycolate oxidase iron-sulfur subunit